MSMKIAVVLMAIGLFLIIAGPTLVQLWFMPRQLEILKMDMEIRRLEGLERQGR